MNESIPSSKATPAVAFCFLANAVLSRETWARERLEPFAGQGFEVRLPLVSPFSVVVTASGRIEPADAPAAAILAPNGVTGDSALADELRYLRQHLRPDIEEELSRFMGDVAAHRLAGAARSFVQWQLDAIGRLGEAVADYAVEEKRSLVRRPELRDFAQRVAELEQALGRLGERVKRL